MIDAFGVDRPDLEIEKKLPSAVRAGGGGIYGQSLRATRRFGRTAAAATASPASHAPYAAEHNIALGRSAKGSQQRWLARRGARR